MRQLETGTFALVLTLLWAALGPQAFAARFHVEPTNGIGVDANAAKTATELVRTGVAQSEGGHEVASSPIGADFTLRPQLMKLGNSHLLKLEKVRAGKVVVADQVKFDKLDELDKAALRLTRAVVKGTTLAERVDEVSSSDATEPVRRRPTRSVWYLGLGTATPSRLGTGTLGLNLAAAYGWDLNRFLLRLALDYATCNGAHWTALSIGPTVFATMTDFSPYATADFGVGLARANLPAGTRDRTASGFVLGFGTGVQMFRTSSINLDLGLRYAILLEKNSLGTPSLFTFRAGLLF